MRYKIENWKGKRMHVLRDDRGKILSRRKYKRSFDKKAAFEKLKKDNSLIDNKRVIFLGAKRPGNLKEEIIYKEVKDIDNPKKLPRVPRSRDRYQYFIEAVDKDGNRIAARSEAHSIDFDKKEARKEAISNFYMRLSQYYGLDYDDIMGDNVFQREKDSLKTEEGVITYGVI